MYDIVFWGHVNNGIDRYLPLIVSLNERGVKCLLFYQNYDFKDGLSGAQIKIVEKYKINIMDYSHFFKSDPLLRLTTLFVRIFKRMPKCKSLYNKFIGLRSKILQLHIDEKAVEGMFDELDPKISFFDHIILGRYCTYPYGSYYIKKIGNRSGIRSFSISHGGTTHIPKSTKAPTANLDYDRIYEPNVYEKEWDIKTYNCPDEKVLPLGDPRFDTGWKHVVKRSFSEEVKRKIGRMGIKKSAMVILYLTINLEQEGEETAKYKNLRDIARLCKALGDTALLIKPHPRYRNEGKIREIMKADDFKDYFILEDDPVICYLDHVDFIISMGTTALYDALPEAPDKVVIYDNFCESIGYLSIFREDLTYFNSYDKLYDHIRGASAKNRAGQHKAERVQSFCKKWVSADRGLDKIIRDITDDICGELSKSKGLVTAK